jgi:uncharacterized membrane protein YiaA
LNHANPLLTIWLIGAFATYAFSLWAATPENARLGERLYYLANLIIPALLWPVLVPTMAVVALIIRGGARA